MYAFLCLGHLSCHCSIWMNSYCTFCVSFALLDIPSAIPTMMHVFLVSRNIRKSLNDICVECISSWVDLLMCRIVEFSKYYVIFIYFQAAVSALLAVSVLYIEKNQNKYYVILDRKIPIFLFYVEKFKQLKMPSQIIPPLRPRSS